MPTKTDAVLTPGWRDVIVNKAATTQAVKAYRETLDDIHSRAGPYVPVQQRVGSIQKHKLIDWLRNKATKRADGTEASASGFEYVEQLYSIPNYSHASDLSVMQEANADEILGLRQDKIEFATGQASLKREVEFSNEIFPTGDVYYNGTTSASSPVTGKDWTQTGSTPIKDIRDARLAVKGRWGRMPNTLFLGIESYETLLEHPDIIERVNQSSSPQSPAVLGMGSPAVAELLRVDRIWVVGSSVAGRTANSASFINARKGLLCYLAPDNAMTSSGLTTFRTYVFTGIPGTDTRTGIRSRSYFSESIESTRFETSLAAITLIEFPELGYSWNQL